MADDQHGPRIVADHLLQEVERFKIEIVRRLVQNQQVRGLRQRTGQHQSAALAARQHADRGPRLLGREQEILHVARDMLRLSTDRHIVAAAHRSSPLPASKPDRAPRASGRASPCRASFQAARPASVGLESAGDEVEQRRLASTIWADDADAVAALDADREILDD